MNVELNLSNELTPSDPAKYPVLIIGPWKILPHLYDHIKCKIQPHVSEETFHAAVDNLQPTESCPLWLSSATIAALPNKCSRHNAPSRAHALTRMIRGTTSGTNEYIVLVCERSNLFASVCAIARAFPRYTRKSNHCSRSTRTVHIEIILASSAAEGQLTEVVSDDDLVCLKQAMCGVRLAARITDMPCSEMHTDAFIQEICQIGEELDIEPMIIQGDDLLKRRFGGIHAVGRAAVHQPALVVLSHKPIGATKSIAWVGKGIVYDTGGLSIKAKSSMPGMKRDCGGAAGVLGAFYTTVKQGFSENLHAVFCLAENAVGPNALRPDDVITLYSNRTVEVNNTDAEGRLVLGDGVSYAAQDLKADVILDMATLTGAQGVATGRYHGVLLTNQPEWEEFSVSAGRASADLVHPMIYCPELHFTEFSSSIADMKNSSADRSNAEVSCAGLFIGAHLGFDFPGVWLHVDMAYPVHTGERATGYGVGLLTMLFGSLTQSKLLKLTAPKIHIKSASRARHCYKQKPQENHVAPGSDTDPQGSARTSNMMDRRSTRTREKTDLAQDSVESVNKKVKLQ